MNPLRLLASCLVLALLAACDRGPLSLTSTTPPTPLPSPPQPPALPLAPAVLPGDTPPTSVLGVTNLDVPNPTGNAWISYYVTLTLTELTGESGAWIRSMELRTDLTGGETDCPWRDFRIAPGATWDSWRLSYCQPYVFSPTRASQLTLSITYTDDEGHPGSLERVVDLTR